MTRFNRLAGNPLAGIVTMMIGTSALLLASQPAAAEAPRRVAVSIAGVDIATAHGLLVIRSRVHRAAKQVCSAGGLRDVRSQQQQARCVETAVSRWRMQLANIIASRPHLAAADAARSPSVVSPEDVKSS